jgi:hypothetical protein
MAIPLNGSSFEAPRYDAPVVRIPWSIPGYAFTVASVAAMFRLAIPPLEMIVLAPGNVSVYALTALRLLPDQPVGGAALTLGIAVLVSGFFWTMAGVAGWNMMRQLRRASA